MSDKNSVNFIVRPMKVSDCEQVIDNWCTIHIDHGINDNKVMLQVDPGGLYVAEEVGTGKVIGQCAGINHSPDLAFIGQFGVRPEYQGKGVGSVLFRTIMAHIGKERNIGLHSLKHLIPKYRDGYGFNLDKTHKVAYSGKIHCNLLTQEVDGVSVVPIDETNIEKVIQYDKKIYSLDRTAFLKALTNIDQYVSRVAVHQNGDVLGYCVLTITNNNNLMPEPLYSDDQNIAELLIVKCCQSVDRTHINGFKIVCTRTNPKSVAIATKLGLHLDSDNVPVLFTKQIYLGQMDRVFAMSSRLFYPF